MPPYRIGVRLWYRRIRVRVGVLVLLSLCGGLAAPLIGRAQITELPRPAGLQTASFGVSVALGNSVAVVGASSDSTCGPNAGAVYVYERVSDRPFDVWRVAARLTPRPCLPNAFFGEHVALSEDRLFVSASASASTDEQATNAAYMFRRAPDGSWRQTARFTPPHLNDGPYAADIDLHGSRAVVSTAGDLDAKRGGAVYVYEHTDSTGTWRRTARLTAERGVSDGVLGQSVALHGNHLAVAASTYFDEAPGTVYVYEYDPGVRRWHEAARLQDIDAFFIELALHDTVLLVGEDRAGPRGTGEATTYARPPSGDWGLTSTLRPSQPYVSGAFGTSVALGSTWALVTGYGEQLGKNFNIDRVVYAFRHRQGRAWTERALFDIGEVDFGAALALHHSTALVSSVPDTAAGRVYLIQLR